MPENMRFQAFSKKQLTVLTWWCRGAPIPAVIAFSATAQCAAAKQYVCPFHFSRGRFTSFPTPPFAICGKTVASLRRNVVQPLLPALRELGFTCTEKLSRNMIEISRAGRQNHFYLFGGRDESSASLIQGMTLGGVLLDEGTAHAALLCGAGARALLAGGLKILVQL